MRDVFISYSTKDKVLANRICDFLETRKNVTCWIAHRDIVPGADWPTSIINAINSTRAMVLIVTPHANESAQMARELARADSQHLPVIALRAGADVEPAKTLAYFLSTSHWMDLFPPPLEPHLDHLGDVIRHMLANEPLPQPPQLRKPVDRRGLFVAGGALGAAVLGAGGWWYLRKPVTHAPQQGANASANSGTLSITVLPLKDQSQKHDQEYFSGAQTEAITTALAQLPGLTLLSPRSAVQLGKSNADLQTIGEVLHVNYVIDGTVHWADQQVQVVAQLVRVANNQIVWQNSYMDAVTNVMALQNKIAQWVATHVQQVLKLPGVVPAQASTPSLDDATAIAFQQGKAKLQERARAEPGGPLTEAAQLFESVLQKVPDYLPAKALLVQVYSLIPAFHALFATEDAAQLKKFNDPWVSKAEEWARKVIAQAPDNSIALSFMGLAQNLRGHLMETEDYHRRAYSLDPTKTDILHLHSLFLLTTGKVSEADALRKKLQKLEPLVPSYAAYNIASAWVSGDQKRTQAMLENLMLPLPPEHPFIARQWALLLASQGKFTEASQAALKAAKIYNPKIVQAVIELLLAVGSGREYQAPYLGFFSILHVYSKTPERALDYFETNVQAGFWPVTEPTLFWHRSKEFVALRNTERFRALMRDTKLTDFWQARGLPDLCKGSRAEDFCRG